MTKFNPTKKGSNITTNYEGDKAYKMTTKLELYSTVCVANLEPRFYEKDGDTIKRIRDLVGKCDPVFVAKLASYTRNKMHLRSIPIVLTAELAKIHNGDNLVRKTCANAIKRADEITEVLSYYSLINSNNHIMRGNGQLKSLCKMSKQLQKGVADSFHRFDEYQFGKYNRNTNVTIKDAMFLTHPEPMNDKEVNLFNKIANDTLDIPYTWEVEFSKLGQQQFSDDEAKELAFQKKWEELIDSKKLGYMATMRNLRNMLNNNVSQNHMIKVAKFLSDKDMVERAKQLPFRYLSTYRTLIGETSHCNIWGRYDTPKLETVNSPYVPMLLNALEDAVKVSANNIKGYDYDTNVMIACDVSGSMQTSVSKKSVIALYDIGLLLGMILQHRCKNVLTGIFGDTFKVYPLPQSSILQNVDKMYEHEGEVGYSTNGYKVIEHLINNNIKMDKVMIFTDCQMWNSYNGQKGMFSSYWSRYKQMYPDAKLYLFNLAGYGTTPIQVGSNGVYLISGWSDKIFEILYNIEKGSSAIKEIDNINL